MALDKERVEEIRRGDDFTEEEASELAGMGIEGNLIILDWQRNNRPEPSIETPTEY